MTLLLTAIAASASYADDSSVGDPEEPEPPIAEAQVSTSPASIGLSASPHVERATPNLDRSRPLTRAAAQKRVDEMSPMGWLTRYGQVTVGHTE